MKLIKNLIVLTIIYLFFLIPHIYAADAIKGTCTGKAYTDKTNKLVVVEYQSSKAAFTYTLSLPYFVSNGVQYKDLFNMVLVCCSNECCNGYTPITEKVWCIDEGVTGGMDLIGDCSSTYDYSGCQTYTDDWGKGLGYIYSYIGNTSQYDEHVLELASRMWGHYMNNYRGDSTYKSSAISKAYDDPKNKMDNSNAMVKSAVEIFEKTKTFVNNTNSNTNVSKDIKLSKEVYEVKGEKKIKITIATKNVNINDVTMTATNGLVSSSSSWTKVNSCTSGYTCYEREITFNPDLKLGTYNIKFSHSYSVDVYSAWAKVCWWKVERQRYLVDGGNTSTEKPMSINRVITIKKVCEECAKDTSLSVSRKSNMKNTLGVTTTCSDGNKITFKETELCNLIPDKCSTVNQQAINKGYLINKDDSNRTCDIYCTDEIVMELFDKPKGNVYAGRTLVYDILNNGTNFTGKLNVKRRCALIPKVNNGCSQSAILNKLREQKPISCNLVNKFDTGQGTTFDSGTYAEILNGSITNNIFDLNNIKYARCGNDFNSYCSAGSASCKNGGDMNGCNAVNPLRSYKDLMGNDVIKVELTSKEISFSQNKNIYQKSYSTILSKEYNAGWYKLDPGVYVVNKDVNNGEKFTTQIGYKCLGVGKNAITGTYSCDYTVKNQVTKSLCEDIGTFNGRDIECFSSSVTGDKHEELSVFFRTVDLTKMIPASREDGTGNSIIGVNWSDAMDSRSTLTTAQEEINKLEEEYRNNNIWNKTPEYVVTITPDGIKEILDYNDEAGNNYQNETLEYDKSQGYWKSSALTELNGKSGITVTRSSTFKNNMYNNY